MTDKSRGTEEIEQIKARVERLEQALGCGASDREAELERSLGIARYELRGLLRDNEGLRERVEELDRSLAASRKEILELSREIGKRAEGEPTFEESASKIVDAVLRCAVAPGVGYEVEVTVPGARRAALNAKIERVLQLTARCSISTSARGWAVLRWAGSPATERPDVRRFGTDVAALAAFERALGERGAAQLVAVLRESAQDFPKLGDRHPPELVSAVLGDEE